jgi:2-alkyl-3-oxoalkanoate reductase
MEQALRESGADVAIDELTALPMSPAGMAAAAEGDRRLRREGGGNLLAAARRLGVRR